MNWLDWVIIFLVGFSAFQGLRYGLFLSMARFAGILFGMLAAYHYYKPLSAYLVGRWRLDEVIAPLITQFLKPGYPLQKTGLLQPGKFTAAAAPSLPDYLGKADPQALLAPYGEALARSFSNTAVEAASFLLIFFGVAWLINLAGLLLTRVADFSLLGPFNRFGGFLFGLFRGIACAFILLLVLAPFQRSGAAALPGAPPASSPSAYGKAFRDSLLFPYFEPLIRSNAVKFTIPLPWDKNTVTRDEKVIL
ncbi:MAG: CvpA family protein [Firmicutes bacterium]|nr:CvpA family protein [Bacillota bacterium]